MRLVQYESLDLDISGNKRQQLHPDLEGLDRNKIFLRKSRRVSQLQIGKGNTGPWKER
jgi:hypothetical protein